MHAPSPVGFSEGEDRSHELRVPTFQAEMEVLIRVFALAARRASVASLVHGRRRKPRSAGLSGNGAICTRGQRLLRLVPAAPYPSPLCQPRTKRGVRRRPCQAHTGRPAPAATALPRNHRYPGRVRRNSSRLAAPALLADDHRSQASAPLLSGPDIVVQQKGHAKRWCGCPSPRARHRQSGIGEVLHTIDKC